MVIVHVLRQPYISIVTQEAESKVKTLGTCVVKMGETPIYKGPYIVTPEANSSVFLKTAGKTMTNDVKVNAVPYFETSNNSGGTTVYIASTIV